MKLRPRKIRKLGWKRDLPDHRDRQLSLVHKTLPKRVDLSGKLAGRIVYDQGDLGSCTANAIAAAVLALEGVNDKTPTLPSRLFIYYGERVLENTIHEDAGAEIRSGMKVIARLGYPEEALWPYRVRAFDVAPTKEVYTEALKDHVLAYYRVRNALQSMRLCLAHGYPFVFGISVYTSFMDANSGEIPMPLLTESLEGGHALLCTGYDDASKRFMFRNSWGASWGQRGYGTIPYAYLEDPGLGGDYWTVRKETTA